MFHGRGAAFLERGRKGRFAPGDQRFPFTKSEIRRMIYLEEMAMDRAMAEKHLQQAREHVALGEMHLARQREILAELTHRGADLTEAKRLLTNFEEFQVIHLAHLDRLKAELALPRGAA
ncbi:hypothetical protein [Rhizobium bangladeshense]|nr:hypothetical protein [Rhizobium bangladeshense]